MYVHTSYWQRNHSGGASCINLTTSSINPDGVLCVALEVGQGGTGCCYIVHCVHHQKASLGLVVYSNKIKTQGQTLTWPLPQHSDTCVVNSDFGSHSNWETCICVIGKMTNIPFVYSYVKSDRYTLKFTLQQYACYTLPPVFFNSSYYSDGIVCVALEVSESGFICCRVTELQGGVTTSLRMVGHSGGVEAVGSWARTSPLPYYLDTRCIYYVNTDLSGSGRGWGWERVTSQ